jgi:hypothetical protein
MNLRITTDGTDEGTEIVDAATGRPVAAWNYTKHDWILDSGKKGLAIYDYGVDDDANLEAANRVARARGLF